VKSKTVKRKKPKKEVDNEVVTLSSLNVKDVLASKRADVFLLFHRKEDCPPCRPVTDEFRRTANAFKDVRTKYFALRSPFRNLL
jgi:peroxiredoxin